MSMYYEVKLTVRVLAKDQTEALSILEKRLVEGLRDMSEVMLVSTDRIQKAPK